MVLFGSMQAVSNVAPPVELERSRAVAIMRRTDPKLACETVEALLAGGMQAIEVTFNSPGALDMLRAIDQAFGARVLLGAGTVLDADDAEAALDIAVQNAHQVRAVWIVSIGRGQQPCRFIQSEKRLVLVQDRHFPKLFRFRRG